MHHKVITIIYNNNNNAAMKDYRLNTDSIVSIVTSCLSLKVPQPQDTVLVVDHQQWQ